MTPRALTDFSSSFRKKKIAGNVVRVSAASTVKAVVGLGRSTVRGMSNVTQRNDDDEGVQQGGLADDA